ncbi:MAG: ribonuclease Z [Flavobacteriaceae bacterium]|nr:ribonuclease Z [Flavobacteriaceae bacterium]
MILDKYGNTTIVFQETTSITEFIQNLTKAYSRIEKDHIILNLFSFEKLDTNDILEFLEISNNHRAKRKSFVLVSKKISYEDVPEEMCLVPSIQEAKDLIEMEEIERDLDLS